MDSVNVKDNVRKNPSHGLVIFIPKEDGGGESRVAATPQTVQSLTKLGASVLIEKGAGAAASWNDAAYEAAGARCVPRKEVSKASLILAVNPPIAKKKGIVDDLEPGACWISFGVPQANIPLVRAFAKKQITFLSMHLLPRISRAQKMDALSSQSNLAGYKAVLVAANHLGKIFPLMMTAAGTLTPAKVLVVGAGVAGLSAIATARRLGAQVEACDVRPQAKEQVESLGASFVNVPFDKDAEDAGGYAKVASEEYQ